MNNVPLYKDCAKHLTWGHDPCPLCLKDNEIARLTAEVETYRAGCDGRDVEILKLEDRAERMRAVVEAAREKCLEIISEYREDGSGDESYDRGGLEAAQEILRALDGEQCPTCHGGTRTFWNAESGEMAHQVPCPTCGGDGEEAVTNEELFKLYPNLKPVVDWMKGRLMRVDGKADIVERLNDPATEITNDLFVEAAEEIERLREENAEMKEILNKVAAEIIAKRLNPLIKVQLNGDLKIVEEEDNE